MANSDNIKNAEAAKENDTETTENALENNTETTEATKSRELDTAEETVNSQPNEEAKKGIEKSENAPDNKESIAEKTTETDHNTVEISGEPSKAKIQTKKETPQRSISSELTIEEKRAREKEQEANVKMNQSKRTAKELIKDIFTNINTYFIVALAASMIAFSINLISFQVLPMKYIVMIILAFLVLVAGLIWVLFSKRIAKINRILTNVLITVITVILCVGCWYFQQANQAIDHITIEAGDKEYEVISVVVTKDNPAEELKDVAEGTFAIPEKIDEEHTKLTLEDIEKQLKHSVKTKSYVSISEEATALLDEKADAMILNEAYRSLLDEDHPKFDTETKVIYTFKIEKEVKKIGSQVDVNHDPYNIYISGIDTYGPIATKSRSDVNMIATVNPQTHEILLTSIPRDYYVAQTCQGNQYDKLTHTGIFGVDCTVESVENFLGISINYYGRVNFSSLENIVDAIGGIDVYNEIGFYSGVDGELIPAGYLHMYGNTALKFARERHAYADGDRQRGRNQMIVLEAILDQAMSPAIITGYSGIMDAMSENFQTNMTKAEMTSIIRRQIDEGGNWTVTQQSVNGEGSTEWCPANGTYSYVMIPDNTTVSAAIQKIQAVMKVNNNQKDKAK